MKLPRAAEAEISEAKVRDYLLNPGNPQNGGKAALFQGFGFARQDWDVLRDALHQHPIMNEVGAVSHSPHGTKYVVECNLHSPDGRNPCLRSIWIVDGAGSRPRLVTAY